MNHFDDLKSKNVDELAEWLCTYVSSDDAPWMKWWDTNYCLKCEPETLKRYSAWYGDEVEMECAWCEINHKCKYFQDMNEVPDIKTMIKLWLLSEVTNNE